MTYPSDQSTKLDSDKTISHSEYWNNAGSLTDEAGLPISSLLGEELVEHLIELPPVALTEQELAIVDDWTERRVEPVRAAHDVYPDPVASIDCSKALGGSGNGPGGDGQPNKRATLLGWREEGAWPLRKRRAIMRMHLQGTPVRKIAKKVNRSARSVAAFIKEHKRG